MTDNLLDQTDLPVLDQNKNYLEELVGEGKKFKSPEELARGKYEADNYVKTLESRMDELRNDYLRLKDDSASRAKLEDLINQMKTQQLASSEQPLANEVTEKPTLDTKQIESLVSTKVQEIEQLRKEKDNFNSVQTKLREVFGDNYAGKLKEQIDNLGLTTDFANDLARKHPGVFMKTFGLESQIKQDNFQAPPKGSVRSDTFRPQGAQKRSWSYYQELKKSDPSIYYSKKIANQMHDDMMSLGEAFKDGDFQLSDRELLSRVMH